MRLYSRKQFLTQGVFSCFSFPLVLSPMNFYAQQRPDPLKAELVEEFVRFGHHDMEGVRQMLDEYPTLINASWDWGNGDFETALGGASHMGERDIAEYLIRNGSRMDIFSAAMLGDLDIIKVMATAHPASLRSKGPHGITLLMHAQKGNSEDVIKFLRGEGITK